MVYKFWTFFSPSIVKCAKCVWKKLYSLLLLLAQQISTLLKFSALAFQEQFVQIGGRGGIHLVYLLHKL